MKIDMTRVAFAASVAGLLVFVAATRYAVMRSATEFRFNLMGWLSAGACLVALMAGGWSLRHRLALYLGIGAALSVAILVVGQIALDYSSYWIQCGR
jgi:hypothetical protein